MKFIDHTTLYVRAGNGGMGCIAFLREKFRPKGGPCGGDGGHGGSVIFRVNKQLSTLQDIRINHTYRAENGQNGGGKNMHGKNGKDIIIKIPPGTIVKDSETEQVLKDLIDDKEEYTIVKGGNGGFGNARFKTQRNTAPKIANDGLPGEERKIDLELKVLADVGLVGFPNAGKSTLISKISNARPKIADYPFTTLVPNLGIVKYGDFKSFVMADIPGLIEGASEGKGLGSQFLKHIERTKVLVYLIECTDEDIKLKFQMLQNELKKHNSSLVDRRSLLLITKTDLIPLELLDIGNLSKEIECILISSVAGDNLNDAIRSIAELIQSQENSFKD
tara:strand:+ start:65 stop:1063 length:999 start_codon:yes stop_codon:yes gene_type:complete